MCTVFRPNAEPKQVKNLGWLLRRLSDIQVVHIHWRYGGSGTLNAFLSDGTRFSAQFASFNVLKRWLGSRRTLRNVTTHVWDVHGIQYSLPCRAFATYCAPADDL